jgi:hypothetical protein
MLLMLPLLPIRRRPAGAFLEPKPSVPAGGPPARASPALRAQFETLLLPEVRPIEIEGDRRRSKEIEGDRRRSKGIEGDRRRSKGTLNATGGGGGRRAGGVLCELRLRLVPQVPAAVRAATFVFCNFAKWYKVLLARARYKDTRYNISRNMKERTPSKGRPSTARAR